MEHEHVGLQFVCGGGLEEGEGGGLELDGDLGIALREPLAMPQVERDAGPAPVVHEEAGSNVGLGLGVWWDVFLLAVAGYGLAEDGAGAILPSNSVMGDLGGSE